MLSNTNLSTLIPHDPKLDEEVRSWFARKPTLPSKPRLRSPRVVRNPLVYTFMTAGFAISALILWEAFTKDNVFLKILGGICVVSLWAVLAGMYILIGVIIEMYLEDLARFITKRRGWTQYDVDRKRWDEEGMELKGKIGWHNEDLLAKINYALSS